jgi:chromosome segregation protein
MEDVIFSGTEVRKPQGFAEVSLVLDNSTRLFPLDYEEVTVTRRVYRSGEGEYFINRNACRLKDIHELFMDTGLGREGYSIVGQGKIDEILSNKSEDRRRIFEEAAGITKYKYRKNEAEKKLERTNENLTRVNDIMLELSSQIEPLRHQSEKAKKYLNLREELKDIEVNAAVVSIEKNKKDLETAKEEYNAVSESILTLQKETEETENAVNSLYGDISAYDEETEALRESQKQATERASEGTNQINLSLANIEHFKENVERIEAEIEKSQRGMSQLDDLLEEYNGVLETHKAAAKEIGDRKAALEAELEKENSLLEAESENVENLKGMIIEKTSEIGSQNGKIVNYNILIESFNNERINAESELLKQKDDYERLVQNNKNISEKLAETQTQLEEIRKKAELADCKCREASDAASKLNEKKNTALAQLSRSTSKKSVLEDMENDFDGYNRSVKAVMTAHASGNLKNYRIYGPLSKLVTTDKKYVTAIETALLNVNQNIVTGDEQDAKAAIRYLKETHQGRVTFMPVSTVKAREFDSSVAEKMPGYIAVSKDIVEYDKLYEGIIGSTLGATVVVDNIDNAIKMAAKCNHKFRIVTLEGEVMQPGGAMSGGSTGKNSGFLSRKAEIDTLTEEIATLKEQLQKTEKEIAENSESYSKLLEEAELARQQLSEKNEEYIRLKAECEHSDKYLSEAEERRNMLLQDISTVAARTKEINEDIALCESRISELEKEITTLREDASGKEGETEAIIARVQTLQENILEVTIKETSQQKDIEIQEERISNVTAEKNEILAEIAEKRGQIDGFSTKIAEINSEIETTKKSLNMLSTESVDMDKRIEELLQLRKEADSKIRSLQEGVKDTRDKLFALGQQKVKAETKLQKLEGDLDGIFAHLWEEYELTYTEALKVRTDENINLTEANRKISELKSKIKGLGNINIDAIEEYKNVKERFDFLTEQTQDLEKAKGELESIIDEMLDIMKQQFAEQFAQISKNFNAVFRELFGGGQANLSLADPDDVLESGVEIEAQPPGKKLQSLTLLSGGERAFTAIALLFAILKGRPTPFCILDEIEAALDDVNVYRYADYLKKYCGKTQFIVVTHRRGTMEAANILYGVTMQEKGVSKLLSLNIDEVTEK